jgi:hypothetical protein
MSRIATALICVGALLWILGAAAWIAGVWITLPPNAVRVLALTLSGLAGGVLLVSGAVFARLARRKGIARAQSELNS